MDNFEQSNKYLRGGAVYGFIAAFVYFAFGASIMWGVIKLNKGFMDPISALFIGSIYLLFFLIGVIIALIGLISIANAIVSIVAINKRRRVLYKLCVVFGGITINPVSRKGARLGMKALLANA